MRHPAFIMKSVFKKLFGRENRRDDTNEVSCGYRPGLSRSHSMDNELIGESVHFFTESDAAALAKKYSRTKAGMAFSPSEGLTGPENVLVFATVSAEDPDKGQGIIVLDFLYSCLCIDITDSMASETDAGGLLAAADTETGKVMTPAVDYSCRTVESYPDSGEAVAGSVIPCFFESKKTVTDFIHENGICGYYEWYVSLSGSGCRLAGYSGEPSAEYLQAPYMPFRKGMRYLVSKYLDDGPCYYGPEQPYGTKISRIDRSGIEFYWKKPERATGYDVFRAYCEEGPYELIAEIRRRGKGIYADSSFDPSRKEIFYSVRSVIGNTDGPLLYSPKTVPTKAEYVTEMTPDRSTLYMYSGTSRKVSISYGWGEPDDIEWSSDSETTAVADDSGMITAVSAGTCKVTCRSASVGQSCDIEVVVDRQPPEPLRPESTRFHFDPASGCWKDPSASGSGRALIMMTGDMMCSSNQMRSQYSNETGWDFSDSFEYVRAATEASDLAVANLETLLASGWPYMVDEAYIDNKNNCNAPARFLDAVRYGGFDMLMLSNNHNCDGGIRALLETIGQIERYEFPYTGVFKSSDDDRFVIVEVNGIKTGFLSYMSAKTSFNGKDADWTKEEKSDHLNVFTEKKAASAVSKCRAAGAEYVIVYMHWGAKNFRNLTEDQKNLAQSAADAGADFIIGSNPHLVQVYEELVSADGRTVPCYYSVGNFLAAMNQVPGNRDSIMVAITLERQPDGSVALVRNEYIPFHCFNKVSGNRWTPVPLSRKYNKTRKKGSEHIALIRDFIGDKASEIR